jgi:hypothetical protein
MYLGIILFGTLHSLIFLPVLLSIVGPPLNKQRLLLLSDPGLFSDGNAFQGVSRGSSPMSDRSGQPLRNKACISVDDPVSHDEDPTTVKIQPSVQNYLPSKYDRSL